MSFRDIPKPTTNTTPSIMSTVTTDHSTNTPMESTQSSLESDSDSDNSLTEQLDQIGKLNINLYSISSYLPTYITNRNFDLGNIELPNIELPNLELPNLELPSFDYKRLPDISGEISRFIKGYVVSNEDEVDKKKAVSSLKTIISTRIQMNNILNDLNLGMSLSNAIDRLQPLRDVIHETVSLPVDDDDMYTDSEEEEPFTEPKGIEEITNKEREQPFLSDLVIPEEDLSEVQRHSSTSHRRRRRAKKMEREDSRMSSELDIEGLSLEETRQLTNLNSLDDFYEENLMRSKIQDIQGLNTISQSSKNKLVTRLMMGNYYKYLNEKLDVDERLVVEGELVLPTPEDQDPDNGYHYDQDPQKFGSGKDQETVEIGGQNSESQGSDYMDVSETESEDEVILTENDRQPSYHDEGSNILGCKHYQRNCKVECSTCLKWFTCRFCHDEQIKDHKLIRSEINHILCMFCMTPQEPTEQYCIECDKELSNYVCFKCKLYDNDYKKDIYHCDKCGICRLGLGLGKDYFHCDECNICLSIDLKKNHKCLNNTTHCDCPICNEYLFTSVMKVVFMNCGHSIHEHCYNELTQHSYKCPICKKTVVNMDTQFRILDQEINQQPLPLPYKLWRCIISCNDCKGKSNVSYHLLGLKCKYCNSYNTNQIKLIKPEEEEQDDEIQANDHIDRMTLVQTSLSNNFTIDNDYDGDNNKSYESSETDGSRLGATSGSSSGGMGFSFNLGKYMKSEDSDEEVEEGNHDDLVNIKQFTDVLINKPGNKEIGYITSIFQKYINHALER